MKIKPLHTRKTKLKPVTLFRSTESTKQLEISHVAAKDVTQPTFLKVSWPYKPSISTLLLCNSTTEQRPQKNKYISPQ